MKVLPQITTSTTQVSRSLSGVKFLRITVGAANVDVCLNHSLSEQAEGDFMTLTASSVYRFTASKGSLFYVILAKSTDASTLDIVCGNDTIEKES